MLKLSLVIFLIFCNPGASHLRKTRGLGFDGASTMSGNRTSVQTRLRLHAPSAIYVHCRCHLLQLAAVNAAGEHAEVT